MTWGRSAPAAPERAPWDLPWPYPGTRPCIRWFATGAIDGENLRGWYWWRPAEPKQGPFLDETAARLAAWLNRDG